MRKSTSHKHHILHYNCTPIPSAHHAECNGARIVAYLSVDRVLWSLEERGRQKRYFAGLTYNSGHSMLEPLLCSTQNAVAHVSTRQLGEHIHSKIRQIEFEEWVHRGGQSYVSVAHLIVTAQFGASIAHLPLFKHRVTPCTHADREGPACDGCLIAVG